jgi:hypothetical protein
MEDEAKRFVQFAFEEGCFHLDIPCQVLSQDEAALISRRRPGFFYLSSGNEFRLKAEDVEGHAPFRAVYFYGDERTAAADMADILYSVWGISLDEPILLSASSFDGVHVWEAESPLATDP